MPGRGNPGCSGAVVRSFLGEVEPDPDSRRILVGTDVDALPVREGSDLPSEGSVQTWEVRGGDLCGDLLVSDRGRGGWHLDGADALGVRHGRPHAAIGGFLDHCDVVLLVLHCAHHDSKRPPVMHGVGRIKRDQDREGLSITGEGGSSYVERVAVGERVLADRRPFEE